MDLPKLEIIEGDVVKAQLTSETHVAGQTSARARSKVLVSSKVVTHLRLFLIGKDGKERDFQFSNTTVGVREGHKVAIVRAKPKGPGPWLSVALYNLTTQMREDHSGAFARAARQQWMPARLRAGFWALGVFLVYWPVSEILDLRGKGFTVALAFAVLAYPLAWAIGAVADRLVLPARQRAAEKALRFAIDEMMSHAKKDREAAAAKAADGPPQSEDQQAPR